MNRGLFGISNESVDTIVPGTASSKPGIESGNCFLGEYAGWSVRMPKQDIAQLSGNATANTFIGFEAAQSNTTGDSNTVIGYQAAQANTTGSGNVVIGYGATSTNLSHNVVIGYKAGEGGGSSVVIGGDVGGFGATSPNGGQNVVIGAGAGCAVGSGVVAIGFLAGGPNGNQANQSVCIGLAAGLLLNTTTGCTVIGWNAAPNMSTGTGNTCVGQSTARSIGAIGATTTAIGQTLIGHQTGITSGQGQVNYITCLGAFANAGAAGAVAIGTDHTGAGAATSTQDEIRLGTSNHTVSLSALHFNAAANESTGSGSAALGANCPAVTVTAPYTWEKVTTSDGSTGYVPVWK